MFNEHLILNENLSPSQSQVQILTEADSRDPSKPKQLYMQGIFIQGDKRNHNRRVYPVHEIRNAVNEINHKIDQGYSICGEADHPEELNINIDRISHNITKMWMDGSDGMGKLRILPTPCGNIVRSLLESDIRLGVSSRGNGCVDHQGYVSDFEIVTVDIVVTPSAPDAFPVPVLESLNSRKRGKEIAYLSEALMDDDSAQKYLMNELNSWLSEL